MMMPDAPLYVPKLVLQRPRREPQGDPKILKVMLTLAQQPNQSLPKRFRTRLFSIGSFVRLHDVDHTVSVTCVAT